MLGANAVEEIHCLPLSSGLLPGNPLKGHDTTAEAFTERGDKRNRLGNGLAIHWLQSTWQEQPRQDRGDDR